MILFAVWIPQLLFGGIASALTVSTEPECTLHDFHNCLQSLQSVTQGSDLAFAATRNELEAVCKTLKDSVQCVDDHMKLCFTPTQRKVFNHVVAGARQVLVDLCTPGPTQDLYLKHAPCYKNISLSEDKCAPKYRHLMELSETVDGKKNVDEGLREFCCAFSEFVQCKHLHVSRDCGHEAGEYVERHMDRISSPLIHEHCAHYTYGTDSCSSSATVPVGVHLVMVLATLTIWTLYLLINGVT